MNHNTRQQVGLNRHPPTRRDVIHRRPRLVFRIRTLVDGGIVPEYQYLLRQQMLLGDYNFEVIAIVIRDEQSQLDQACVLLTAASADEHKATFVFLVVRLLSGLEKRTLSNQAPPTPTTLDQFFQGSDPGERYGYGELYPSVVRQQLDDVTMTANWVSRQETKAAVQTRYQLQLFEQLSEYHEAGETGQLPAFEPQVGDAVNVRFATLYGHGLFWFDCAVGADNTPRAEAVFYCQSITSTACSSHFFDINLACHPIVPAVNYRPPSLLPKRVSIKRLGGCWSRSTKLSGKQSRVH